MVGQMANDYGLDVLDLHYQFRQSLQHRMSDGVHWDVVAHRRISSLVLQHAADAWGVTLEEVPCSPALPAAAGQDRGAQQGAGAGAGTRLTQQMSSSKGIKRKRETGTARYKTSFLLVCDVKG